LPRRTGDEPANKAIASRKPRGFEPGDYTAILEPSAVLDIIAHFFTILPPPWLITFLALNDRMGKNFRRKHNAVG